MREKLFKLLFNKEWLESQNLKEMNAKREEKNVKNIKQIVQLNTQLKNYDLAFEKLKVKQLKNNEIVNDLYNYIEQVKSGNFKLKDNNYGIEELTADNVQIWMVDEVFCKLGGCTIESRKFDRLEYAEVFTSLMTILGEETKLSVCWECRQEYNQNLM